MRVDFKSMEEEMDQLAGCNSHKPTKRNQNITICIRVAEPEPAFLAGAEAEKITKFRLRLRLLVNCKAENYELKTLKNLFSSLIQKVVPKVEM